MGLQLKAKESVREGIMRNVKREIEKTLGYLNAETKSRRRDRGENEAVHDVRKCFKKVRAALRLVRGELGNEVYHEENFSFRDAARPLTEVRDAEMLVETWEKLREIAGESYVQIHEALLANREDVSRRVLEGGKVISSVERFAITALKRIPVWAIDHDGWEAIESGLRRVYRAGHRAHLLTERIPSMENLHEWRKQSKYLWHQLQLLESSWAPHEKDLGEQFHTLSTLLGDDHDLAVLRQTLAADPLIFGGHRALKVPLHLLDRKRGQLERKAFTLGRKLYKDAPKDFTSRIEAYWRVWRGEPSHTEILPKNLLVQRATPMRTLSTRVQREIR